MKKKNGKFSSSEREQESSYNFQVFLEQEGENKGRNMNLLGFPVAYEKI